MKNLKRILALGCVGVMLCGCGNTTETPGSQAVESTAAKVEDKQSTESGTSTDITVTESKEKTYLAQGESLIDASKYDKTVTVSNTIDFANAIDNDTLIIMEPGEYNLTYLDYYDVTGYYFHTDNYSESGAWVLGSVDNLAIMAKEPGTVRIVVDEGWVPVLMLEGCEDIVMENLTLGHNVEPGTCCGSVIEIQDTNNYSANGMHLYGCGTYAYVCDHVNGFYVYNSELYECSDGIIYFDRVKNGLLYNCDMHDNQGYTVMLYDRCSYIDVVACTFVNNGVVAQESYNSFVGAYNKSSDITYTDCTFTNNHYSDKCYIADSYNITMKNCTFDDNN